MLTSLSVRLVAQRTPAFLPLPLLHGPVPRLLQRSEAFDRARCVNHVMVRRRLATSPHIHPAREAHDARGWTDES